MLSWLKDRTRLRHIGRDLYGSIVTQARRETFYAAWGVPDSMDGRLEVIILHVSLVLDRLVAEGEAGHKLGQALTEAFVTDVDDALRQIGVGDMGVPRRVKKATAALYERQDIYRKALLAAEPGALTEAIATLAEGEAFGGGAAHIRTGQLAAYVASAARALARQDGASLLAGRVEFQDPAT